jgi:flagellar biosynthetic protein FliS
MVINLGSNMTDSHNPYAQAMQAYKKAEASKSLNGFEIATKLYAGILKNLYDCKRAYENKNFEEIVEIHKNTFDILEALQSSLSFEDDKAVETSDFLYRFYNIIFVKVAQALEQEDPAAEYEALINYVKPVYDRWKNLAEPEKAEAHASEDTEAKEDADQPIEE